MTAKKPKETKNIYKVTGSFKKGKKNQPFTKEILMDNKKNVEEYVYSILGSKHRVKRKEITITKIEEISSDKVTNPIIKQQIGGM